MNEDLPVLILQHQSQDGPAHLAHWLNDQGVRWVVVNTEAGQAYPAGIEGYRALAVLGGEMSANDPLPSLRQAERLIVQAIARQVPVFGHCLGGQLMARALGARVVTSPAPEIGWQPWQVEDSDPARDWFGDAPPSHVFHWHAEAFELPSGAVGLARSRACPVQAFAYGRHLAMQCHVELDETKLAVWAASRDPSFLRAQRQHASVQSGAQMLADAPQRLACQQALADRLYRRWLG